MGHILLLSAEGHGSHGFTKSRLEAFRHALRHHEVSELSVSTASDDFQNPFHSDFKTRLEKAVSGAHAVVTCGPFHPLLALPQHRNSFQFGWICPQTPWRILFTMAGRPAQQATITAHAMAKLASKCHGPGDHFGLISPELVVLSRPAFWQTAGPPSPRACHPNAQPLEPQLPPPQRQPKVQ